MGYMLKIGETNTIPAGTVIFGENEPVYCICAVVKGKVRCSNASIKVYASQGSFIGIVDSVGGRYKMDYVCEENTMLYPFPVADVDSLKEVALNTNRDYKGLMIGSLAKFYSDVYAINKELHILADDICDMLQRSFSQYTKSCQNGGVGVTVIPAMTNLTSFKDEEPIDKGVASYNGELARVPADVIKAFFANSTDMTLEFMMNLVISTDELLYNTEDVARYLTEKFPILYNDGDKNLLVLCGHLAKELEKSGRPDKKLISLCNDMKQFFDKTENSILRLTGGAEPVDRDHLEKVTLAINSEVEMELEENEEMDEKDSDILRSLKDSMRQIIFFSKLPQEETKPMQEAINRFVDSKDRFSTEDVGRSLRHGVAEQFYILYKAVFYQALEAENIPRAVELFLNFGFLDDRLVSKEEQLELARLNIATKQKYPCNTYTIPEWLLLVMQGKKEPSKNEFDMEYADTLRELKRNHEIDDIEEKRRLKDPDLRLEFELNNFFKYNHRIVSGMPSMFVPILCSEQMSFSPNKAAISKDRMGQLVNKHRSLDYSVYYRSILYANAAKNIEKEPVQLEVVPDIILFPTFGSTAIMWQEISNKRRDSAGRFVFPILCDGNLDDLMIRTNGRFRWELCRTMQGSAWNNIQVKSLTSEFSDYIQFYKKNHALSDEKKERVKNQLAKGKNNAREVFIQDYEQWIKFESAGGMKLNKVAREIIAMYVPFNREVREGLKTQAAYVETIGRFDRERQKMAREQELRIHALTKRKIEVPDIINDTLKFYKDM